MSSSDRELLERLLELVEHRYYGKYQGFVVDNADPQKRGRLRVLVPEVLGDVCSGWAEACFPYGGGTNFGTFSVPPVTRDGDAYTTGVWVEFRGGDPQFPIWVGAFYGTPQGSSEGPGDDVERAAEPDVNVHVTRTSSGHSLLADDTPGQERFELRDASNQSLVFESALKDGVKRDENGNVNKATRDLDYPDLVNNAATVTLTDFAGNQLLLDADKSAPTLRITNADRDGKVLQTIELNGASSDAKIVITDNQNNVVTLSRDGILIDSKDNGDSVRLDSTGVAVDAPKIDLNQGSKGAARKDDRIESAMMTDPDFWSWMMKLQVWANTHAHVYPVGPPATPFPGAFPTKCTGKIIDSSESVVIGD